MKCRWLGHLVFLTPWILSVKATSSRSLRTLLVDEEPSYGILISGTSSPCLPAAENSTLLCDPNHLLSDDDIDKIASQLTFLKKNSTFQCLHDGINMGIFIRHFRRPRNSVSVDNLRTAFSLGPCGVLLYMVVTPSNQAFVYMSWGYELERVLSGLVVQSVKDGMLPFLRRGLYGEAIHAATLDLTAYLEGDPTALQGYLLSEHLRHLGFASWLLLFCCSCFGYLPLCCLDLFLGYRAWRRQRIVEEERHDEILQEVEEKMEEIEEHYRNSSNNQHSSGQQYLEGDYMSNVCPICLEPFPPNGNEGEEDGIATENTPLFQKGQKGSDGKPIKSLPCGHVFDRTCITEWMVAIRTKRRMGGLTCPVCNMEV
ncbi:expressed unknown protein [Seminavis robusta]|uniref:RING-type domain-containing protein n=1 Tax=Seminavis robusta TaxID=568900 RepID=A0A9N8HRK9_9STRA|nr:expressed unknown protein [Seminavis robusta]|eukprot:Sro1410_g270230.1 n/a (370) ;mRNA; f:1455-2564